MYSNRRLRNEDETDSSADRWLVSYADFITLLFAFFAILYATSEKDLEKTKEFQESIKRYLIRAGAFGETGQQIHQGQKNNTVIEPPIQTFQAQKTETTNSLEKAELAVERMFGPKEKAKFIQDIYADEWGVRISLKSESLFAPGSDKFKSESLPFLKKVAGLAADSNQKIMVEGHVKQGEIGYFRSTWELSSARAINFVRFIEKTQNYPANKLAAAALADSRPLVQDLTAEKNSRMEVVLMSSDAPL